MRRSSPKRPKASWFKSDKPRHSRRGSLNKRYLGSRARRSFSKRRYK